MAINVLLLHFAISSCRCSRDMFIEYLQWLNETSPELLVIAGMMYRLQKEKAPKEELDRLRKLWNEFAECTE